MVARLDDGPLRAALDTASSTVRHLQAELEAARFQLISAGPNGQFGDEDDITNFKTD